MLTTNVYFFSKLFYRIINKFCTNGNKNKIEFFFESFLFKVKKKKNCYMFLIFLEVLSILRLEAGVKILKYAKSKRIKRRKKGKKIPIRTKVIPIALSTQARFNLILKWITARKKNNKKKFFGLFSELISIISYTETSVLKDKKNLQSLIARNRGFIHYRW